MHAAADPALGLTGSSDLFFREHQIFLNYALGGVRVGFAAVS